MNTPFERRMLACGIRTGALSLTADGGPGLPTETHYANEHIEWMHQQSERPDALLIDKFMRHCSAKKWVDSSDIAKLPPEFGNMVAVMLGYRGQGHMVTDMQASSSVWLWPDFAARLLKALYAD